jgi:hypothetical protein
MEPCIRSDFFVNEAQHRLVEQWKLNHPGLPGEELGYWTVIKSYRIDTLNDYSRDAFCFVMPRDTPEDIVALCHAVGMADYATVERITEHHLNR